MNILCTGISCSGRKELMADFESLCREKDMQIGFFNVGDYMKHTAAESGVKFTEKVLDSDHAVLSLARRSAFYEIANLAHNADHALIGLHTCFRWRGVLVEGISLREIDNFPADVFINVVDNLADIEKRMQENPQWTGMQRGEINVWLDEEEFLTKQLASFKGKPHYNGFPTTQSGKFLRFTLFEQAEILFKLSNHAYPRICGSNREDTLVWGEDE